MGEKGSEKGYSVEAYLTLEALSEVRHEYHQGRVVAMAGGTYNHSKIAANLLVELDRLFQPQGCEVLNGDLRIRIDAADRFLYPEASVICGEPVFSQQDPNAITNPVLIAEVLSESTEAYDRGRKFFLYQQLASFATYLLIDQYRPLVTLLHKSQSGTWNLQNYFGREQVIPLPYRDASLPMEALYRQTRDLQAPLEG